MPRQARVILPGVPHHIFQRTQEGTACFRSDQDYQIYLSWLREYLDRTQCTLHAYVIMRSEVHLLITPDALWSCGELMRRLGQRYTLYANQKYGLTGPLWETRYRSCIVCERSHILACYRYIETTPVRAGKVAAAEDYPWTSFRVNALGEETDLIRQEDAYYSLGANPKERQRYYLEAFGNAEEAVSMGRLERMALGNRPFASDALVPHLESRIGRRVTLGVPGRPRRQELDQVAEPPGHS